MSNRRNTSRQLRDLELFSGNDQFMQNGHQIINSNRANAGPRRKNAAWAASDAEVQALLANAFPKWKTDENQRKKSRSLGTGNSSLFQVWNVIWRCRGGDEFAEATRGVSSAVNLQSARR